MAGVRKKESRLGLCFLPSLVFYKKEYAAVVSSSIGGTGSVWAKQAGKRPTARTIGK